MSLKPLLKVVTKNMADYDKEKQALSDEKTIDTILFAKLVLNCVFILYVHVGSSEYDETIEESCLKAIKLSLEKPVVPIWKFIILFYTYLRNYFGDVNPREEPIRLTLR